jgi:hypothetical protein
MKKIITILLFSIGAITVSAQNKTEKKSTPNPSKPVIAAEASCGKCQLGLKSNDCDLAVRINGKSYFVDGVHIDSLGDAHAKDGMCNAIRKAHVQGEVVNDRFKATYFVLDPKEEKKNK